MLQRIIRAAGGIGASAKSRNDEGGGTMWLNGHKSRSGQMVPRDACANVERRKPPLDLLAEMARCAEQCRSAGVDFTPLRRLVLEILIREQLPMGAYELVERMRDHRRPVAPASMYRLIAALIEAGVVRRIVTKNAFVFAGRSAQSGRGDALMICRCCGNVEVVASSDVDEGLHRMAEATGFRPSVHVVEIEGECGRCLAEERA
jgi:Fur family zinc uptake transcriptional regulator